MKNLFHSVYLLVPLFLLLGNRSVQAQSVSVKDFVTRNYDHGVPYLQAKSLGKEALPELFKLLNDNTYEEYRPTIILTVGMIGEPSAVDPLIKYFQTRSGELSLSSFISTLNVFQALGYIAQSGDTKSINFLTQWTDQNQWKKSSITYSHNGYQNERLGGLIGRMAIQGLGISGRPEALKTLENLKNEYTIKGHVENTPFDWKDDISSAIDMNEGVRTKGANKVFGRAN